MSIEVMPSQDRNGTCLERGNKDENTLVESNRALHQVGYLCCLQLSTMDLIAFYIVGFITPILATPFLLYKGSNTLIH